jgi:N-acetylmuramoyl-L-alanine amidase
MCIQVTKLIIQFVSEENKAWHAGVSSWKGNENLNETSIGVEFHAPGYGKEGDLLNFGSFVPEQLALGLAFNKFLKQKYDLKAENFLAHSDIAPFRYNDQKEPFMAKTDPGPFFPWREWAQEGIGIWYEDYQGLLNIGTDQLICWVQAKLFALGYCQCPQNGKLDLETQYCIQAFRLHWMSDLWDVQHAHQLSEIDEVLLRRLYCV